MLLFVLRWEKCHLQLLTGVLWNALSLLPSGKNNMGFLKAPYYRALCTTCACFDLLSVGNLLCAQNVRLFYRDDKSVRQFAERERRVKMNLN